MTKQELEEKIAKGESVWHADDVSKKVYNIDLNEKYKPRICLGKCLYVYENVNNRYQNEYFIEKIFATKQQAEHYLCHANITRTETLPFLTWTEFKNGGKIRFIGADGLVYLLEEKYSSVMVICLNIDMAIYSRFSTEENFYRAYDECVKLFKQN